MTLPKQHDGPFLIKEAPDIANVSGVKIYLKIVELKTLRKKFKYFSSYSNEKKLNNAKNEFKSLFLRNLRSRCEELQLI